MKVRFFTQGFVDFFKLPDTLKQNVLGLKLYLTAPLI